MNIVSGDSAVKEHWSRGSRTACNRKISVNKNETNDFKEISEKHPEVCCSKCLSQFSKLNKK